MVTSEAVTYFPCTWFLTASGMCKSKHVNNQKYIINQEKVIWPDLPLPGFYQNLIRRWKNEKTSGLIACDRQRKGHRVKKGSSASVFNNNQRLKIKKYPRQLYDITTFI